MRSIRAVVSLRARIALVAGVVLALGAAPAWASWSAQQSVPSQKFDLGTLELQVNGQTGTAAVDGLSLSNMAPTDAVAGLVTMKNSGTVPLSYWPTIVGSNADGKAMANYLTINVKVGGTVAGSSPAQTCSGGSTPSGAATKLSTTSKVLAYGATAAARKQLLPGTSEVLCVQLSLDATAPSSLQGGSTTVTITANGAQVGQP
jgi:predicted ribosomally synthesized peptide with SipW-like signal peptide